MAYNELVKNFERVRDYMREFYVYGFKSRAEYDKKSGRSYDNERRRVESWLGDYMSFQTGQNGKSVFLSVDGRTVRHNPLYRAFKAKSFTAKDITLHFLILDILADGGAMSASQIIDGISSEYLEKVNTEFAFDESTVRKKLKEYVELGLLHVEKVGRETQYRRTEQDAVDLTAWDEAVSFFSEEDPLGVIGSTLLDKGTHQAEYFGGKHRYILYALDSDILCSLLLAIHEHRAVEIMTRGQRSGIERERTLCPLKIYISAQNGRQYLLGYNYGGKRLAFVRIDGISCVKLGNVEKQYGQYQGYAAAFDGNLWGVSSGFDLSLDHLEMTVRVGTGEEYIVQRLEREKRHGSVEAVDEHHYKFTADVYDAFEMLPWLRTFIGRITELQCSDPTVTERFNADIDLMREMYLGGADNAL